jgi:molybdate transport system substrate-binding protein
MRRVLAILSVGAVALAGCGDDGSASTGAGSIRVFAAASLTDAFADVAAAFETANPGSSVALAFAGSSSLREQVLAGAPADVFASASESDMDRVVDAGEVETAEVFATNRLQIVVPAGNPAAISGLDDLADGDLLVGLCAEEVPCGDVSRRVLEAAGVTPSPDTEEPDARALLTKVAAGELDVGLVYVTDVASAGDRVEGIDVPADIDVVATYAIGALAGAGNPGLASAFVEFVRGDDGQAILADHGFGGP